MVYSVDRGKFKTCEQSGFCRRHRAVDGSESIYSILKDSIHIKHSYISFNILNTKANILLKGEIIVIEKGIYRFKVNELTSQRARYESIDSLVQQLPHIEQILNYNIEDNMLHVTSDSISIDLQFQPLKITLREKDTELLIINNKNLFKFEHFRSKPGANQNSIDEKDEEDDPIPSNEVGENQDKDDTDIDSNDSKKDEKEKDDDGSWEETFGGHTDSKPNGPMSVGMDITFPGFQHLYGIPEHADSFALKSTKDDQPYRLYNFDVFEYEIGNKMALYGSIPFMLAHNTQRTLGVFWNNPSETWIDVSFDKGTSDDGVAPKTGSASTHWFSETGIVDLFLLLGPTASHVFHQYKALTGVTPLPPISALGYHQSRWNYNDQEDVIGVLNKFEEYDIPLDYIWLDIEYTVGKKYFTWDPVRFPNPLEMIGNLTAKGRKLVIIIDPHIKAEPGYAIHDEANNLGYFVRTKEDKDFEGWCWPGNSKYPDFQRREVRDWWASQFDFTRFPTTTADVMLWNDMNEPSVFSGPEVTMPKDLLHSHNALEHRDIHNLYALHVHAATFQGLVERSGHTKRPFVLSRGFFAGSQRTAAIWTGDNTAEWSHLKITVPMMLSLSVTGMTFSGADVGGFFNNPDEELIRRWYQAGAFQPFFRTHAHIDTKRREPWKFSPKTLGIISEAIYQRYTYLPFWYTLFYESELTGMPVMRPLWVEFPSDTAAFDIDNQHMIGSALMVHPVTDQGAQHVNIYFPGQNEYWYQAMTYLMTYVNEPTFLSVPVKDEDIPVYQRGGTIVPRRLRKRRSATINFEKDPYTLIVALDHERKAKGTLFIDQGDSYQYRNGEYLYIEFQFKDNQMTSKNLHFETYKPSSFVERIVILGIDKPSEILFTSQNHGGKKLSFTYKNEPNAKVLTIKKPTENMHEEWRISFKF